MKMNSSFLRIFFVFVLFYFLLPGIVSSQEANPKLKELLKIEKLELAPIKQQVELGLSIKSKKNVIANISFTSTANTGIPGQKPVTISRTIELIGDITTEEYFNLELPTLDTSLISIHITVPDAPEGYMREYYRYYTLKKNEEDSNYRLIDPRKETSERPKEVGKDIYLVSPSPDKSSLSTAYTVNLSGKILIGSIYGKGLYGNGVHLYFRNSSNTGNWYHPVFTLAEHVHYDNLDEQGNFHFNFSFNGDISGYNQVIILVNTANDAAYLPAPANGYNVWYNNSVTNYFNESEGVIFNITPGSTSISASNLVGIVNNGDGTILRCMKICKEFTIQRYSGSCPFNIPVIFARRVYVEDDDGNEVAGLFHPDSTPYIEINPDSAEYSTTSHEYGHYINYLMWGGNTSGNRDLVEGWAIFYSWAARSYINQVYGDYIDTNDDNTEIGPFMVSPTTRFSNIRYAYHGEPLKAAIACYLWNIYDSYNGGIFETSSYNIGDNDDVSGLPVRVFDIMRSLPYLFRNQDAYHSFFKSGLDSNLQASVDRIFSFMVSDMSQIPSTPMKSAQIKNFTGNVTSSTQISFSWASQSYSTSFNYRNLESGYKLYYKNGTVWQLIITLAANVTSYTYTSPSIGKQYMLTSYNSAGESCLPGTYTPLIASISGPSSLSAYQSGTWTCTASGGTAPYHYQWYYMYPVVEPIDDIMTGNDREGISYLHKPPKGYWFTLGTDSSSLTRSDNEKFQLKCEVRDATNRVVTSNILTVNIGVY